MQSIHLVICTVVVAITITLGISMLYMHSKHMVEQGLQQCAVSKNGTMVVIWQRECQ